jgi:hypothetical protein
MKHTARICLGFILIVAGSVAYVGIYGLYLSRKLKPILSTPGIGIVAKRFAPVAVGKTREIDFGYARFALPDTVQGEPVNVDHSGFVEIGFPFGDGILFCPPLSSSEPDTATFLRNSSALFGKPVRSWYDLKILEVAQAPIPFWRLPFLGKREAATYATLLAFKSLDVGSASAVSTFEDHGIGFILWKRNDRTRLLVADIISGVSQEILIPPTTSDLDELVSALASKYTFRTVTTDLDSINRLLEEAGVKAINSKKVPNQTAEPTRTSVTSPADVGDRASGGSGSP